MSDTQNDTTSTAPSQSFTPEPLPPQVDAAEVNDVLADDDSAHVTATKALQAVQTLVENNRAASQQLESLMGIVLDAAEVANRSASAVASTGTQLHKAAEKLSDGAKSASMQNKIVLALCGSVLVGTAATFSFMTVQLNQKVEQVDAMLLAVGKRAVDLKTRMESLDEIHAALADINLKQDNSQSVQQAIEDKLSAAVEAAKSPFRSAPDKPEKPVPAEKADKAGKVSGKDKEKVKAEDKGEKPVKPEKAAPKVARESELSALSKQFAGIDAQLKEQSNAVRALSSQVNNVQTTASNLDTLKRDVESLATMQKQRYQEALQATAQATARLEKELKDKERELARERELLKERERAQAKERELAQANDKDKEKEKERSVRYQRDQSRPNGSTASNGLPSYAKQPDTETN